LTAPAGGRKCLVPFQILNRRLYSQAAQGKSFAPSSTRPGAKSKHYDVFGARSPCQPQMRIRAPDNKARRTVLLMVERTYLDWNATAPAREEARACSPVPGRPM
jgi:hypothetical protein